MKTFRFRDFFIYREARDFRRVVRGILKQFPSSEQFKLIDQIDRSTLSIILNIAEGSAKNSDKDFARFLVMSIASVNEVIAGFDASFDDGLIAIDQLHIIEIHAENLARQIGSFIQRLRSSGQKLQATS